MLPPAELPQMVAACQQSLVGLAPTSPPPFLPPAELPQMVAAYHSLVGLAATVTSIANMMALADSGHSADGVHAVTAVLGDVIGAVTLTGSVSRGLDVGGGVSAR